MRLKKGVKRALIFICILLIAGVALITYSFLKKENDVEKVKILKEIKDYGYTLKDNKSAAYKELFAELDDVLSKDEVDEKKYVEIISQMFIMDFYSLDEKAAKTDVGGVEFVYPNVVTDFLENAENTIYKYVESNIYKQRNQDLPIVKNITIESVENESFDYAEETDENAFVVKAKWTYKNDSKANGYQNEATLVFIHNDKRLDLVELK